MYCLKVCHNQSPDGWTLAAVCRCSEGPNAPDATLWQHQSIAWTRERKSMRPDILRDRETLVRWRFFEMKVMWKPQALWSILHKTLFDGLLTNCSFSASGGKLICVVKLTEICLCVSHMLTELLDACIKHKYYSEYNLLHRQNIWRTTVYECNIFSACCKPKQFCHQLFTLNSGT